MSENLVCGVGIMDVPGGSTRNGKADPIYRTWCKMLEACFKHQPAKGTICPEWVRYSTYREWHLANVPKGGVIHRDENKHFSPHHVIVKVPKKRVGLKDVAVSVDGVAVSMADVLSTLRSGGSLDALFQR